MSENKTAAVKENPHDEDAWFQWYRAVYPRVFYVLFGKCGGDKALCEDLVQGAIERFIRYGSIEKVGDDRECVAYMITTALRIRADNIKEESRLGVPTQVELADKESESEKIDSLELEKLLQRLSKDDRQIIELALAGHSIRDIANAANLSYSAAGTRIHRIKSNLRKFVETV